MASTVTTTTVATLAAATSSAELAQLLALTSAVLLGVGLLARELAGSSRSARARTLARGLDIGIVPLLVVFLVGLVIGGASVFGQ